MTDQKSAVVCGALNWALCLCLILILLGLDSSFARAQTKEVTIGIMMTLKGPNAEAGALQTDGAILAIEEANAAGGIGGYKINSIVLDDFTSTAGDYDPAQAATNVRKLISDPEVVAIVGPLASGSAKAMAPLLSQADLAAIGPSGTNPDLTDPKLASTYRPSGKVVYFRTVTTDAYQAPGMANFIAEKLNIHSVYVVDDRTAFGIGVAEAFKKRAEAKGMKVLGSDGVDPREADYTAVLTKAKALNPQALYYTGALGAGVKFAKQTYDVLPNVVKLGTDAMLGGTFLKGVGFPAADGWYMTVAAPHVFDSPNGKSWVNRFVKRFGVQPFDYSITTYDAALVALDAIKRVAASGKPIDRHAVREAIQATQLTTLQGLISYDENGDLVSKVISVFQVRHDTSFPDDSMLDQFKYVGVAPEN